MFQTYPTYDQHLKLIYVPIDSFCFKQTMLNICFFFDKMQ